MRRATLCTLDSQAFEFNCINSIDVEVGGVACALVRNQCDNIQLILLKVSWQRGSRIEEIASTTETTDIAGNERVNGRSSCNAHYRHSHHH